MSRNILHIGDQAPDFSANDARGQTIKLTDYADSHVLLVFLRYSGCPFCNLAIHRLTLESKMLAENGCKIIAFIQSTDADINKNVYDRHDPAPTFPIIADQARTYYDQYGIQDSVKAAATSIKDIPYWLQSVFSKGFKQTELDGSFFLVPATFLISPGDQKIVKAEYSSSFYDHQTFTSIYEPLTFRGSQ